MVSISYESTFSSVAWSRTDSCIGWRFLGFQRYFPPPAVSSQYDMRSWIDWIVAFSHSRFSSSFTQTGCLFSSGGNSTNLLFYAAICFLWFSIRPFLTIFTGTVRGHRWLFRHGIVDLRLLLFISFAGDRNPPIGVLRYSRMLRYGSRFLAISTAFSAWPLACGQLGLYGLCFKPHFLVNFRNSTALTCSLWSVSDSFIRESKCRRLSTQVFVFFSFFFCLTLNKSVRSCIELVEYLVTEFTSSDVLGGGLG